MHFEDLSLCYYHPGPMDADEWSVPLLTVGWLDHPQPFPRGQTEPELKVRLEVMAVAAKERYSSVCFRGLHDCTICPGEGQPAFRSLLSCANLHIPGDQVVYVAPGLIMHYLDHGYLPPAEFIHAVMACPDYGSPEYCEALQAANAGNAPPLQTNEVVRARWAAERDAILKWKAEQQSTPQA